MIEDIAIQIRHKLNERRKYKIKDIIFTPNTSIDDIYDLMKKMASGNHDEIAAIRRIHKWGSKSVHKGQVVPISVIWYSLFFVCNRLPSIFGDASKISYRSIKKEYDELIYHHKIRAIKENELFDPSFSNFRLKAYY